MFKSTTFYYIFSQFEFGLYVKDKFLLFAFVSSSESFRDHFFTPILYQVSIGWIGNSLLNQNLLQRLFGVPTFMPVVYAADI